MPKNLPPSWEDSLIWCPEKEMGFHPREPMKYEGPYFKKYIVMDSSKMGALLTSSRVALVRRWWSGPIIDIGIGGGRFVSDIGGFGYDVNTEAVDWLVARGVYRNPYKIRPQAVSCWDSLEHIPEPEKLIERVERYAFVSLPVFEDPTKVTQSKHYRPGEHIWYWSEKGLEKWFNGLGFDLVEKNNDETTIGREGITSFAFRRAKKLGL